MVHDIGYDKAQSKSDKHKADRRMLDSLGKTKVKGVRENIEKKILQGVIGAKYKLGLGLKKKALNIQWSDQLAEELHKPVRRKFPGRRVIVHGIDDIWAADLVEMQPFSRYNKGYKYLLTVIDIFSKYGWIRPLKDKKGESVAEAFKDIMKTSKRKRPKGKRSKGAAHKVGAPTEGRKPNKVWVDKGKEFYNKHVKDILNIYSTENEQKSSVVERFNRTMRERMFKYFTANSTNVYIDVLDDLVKRYNNTKHSSIGMTPVEASKDKNEKDVHENLYGDMGDKKFKPKYNLGDYVRIAKKKGIFEKGYTPRWTEEVFKVVEILHTNPVTYKLKDLNGEEITGSFYEPELQKSKQQVFRIDKVLEKRGKKILVSIVNIAPVI